MAIPISGVLIEYLPCGPRVHLTVYIRVHRSHILYRGDELVYMTTPHVATPISGVLIEYLPFVNLRNAYLYSDQESYIGGTDWFICDQ